VTALPPQPAARALNHVLRSAPLALDRLRKHAGRTARFNVGPVSLAFTVQANGEVSAAGDDAARDLEVHIPPASLPKLASRDENAWRGVRIEGDAEFAQDVSFLARNLDWDVEEDLSRVVGDIAAHRIVTTARSLGSWGREAGKRLAQGAAEYWTEESPLVASRVKVESFVRAVTELREAVDRLEKRVEKLE
jgi:ubiquinone biosynthesis protein UbiJ